MDVVARAVAAPPAFPLLESALEPDSFVPAAVVVPLVLGLEPRVFVVARSPALSEHAGELGFPGGKLLDATESLADAAYRELSEELAVARDELSEVGQLTAVPVVSGKYLITPFVAALRPGARPRIASTELEKVLSVPLWPWVFGRARLGAVRTAWRGEPFILPHFRLEDRVLYGASACILYDLIVRLAHVLEATLPPPVIEAQRPWGDRY